MYNNTFSTKNTSYTNKNRTDIFYERNKRILCNELSKHRYIKIPGINTSIRGTELADWLIEVSSSKELDELVYMIIRTRKRASETKALFQTIAAALIK